MHWLFYRRIVVKGLKNVPKKQPLIFTPNHQNALMDPLAVLFTRLWQVVFLARADIFKNKTTAKLLHSIKIMPVYRERDGKDSLDKNDEIFNKCIDILEENRWLALFPEAAHTDKRSLRPLKKGVPRISFMAEERNKFKLGLKIIPVGIYYSNYTRFRSDLLLIYGNPITVSDYEESYYENEPKALNSLKEKIAEELIPLMIHIKDLVYYDVYEFIRVIFTKNMLRYKGLAKGLYNEFLVQKEIIAELDKQSEQNSEFMPALAEEVRAYSNLLKKTDIEDIIVEQADSKTICLYSKILILILLSPFFIFGYLMNIVPYSISGDFVKKKVKDLQFHSSIRFGFSIILFPLFYLLQSIPVLLLVENHCIKWLFLFSLPLLGIFAFHFKQIFIFTTKQIRFRSLIQSKNTEALNLILRRKTIVDFLQSKLTSF